MSIDSQTLNLTGSLKVSGDVKTNVSSKLGVGTDAPQATVHVSNLHPKVLLEETGAALSSAALLYANNHALNIQVGQEAAADSKANVVFSSYGGQTEHLRIIGSENKVHVPNVLEVSNVEVSNLQATNLAVNVLTIEELTLGVIASLDTVLNTNNQTTNTITTSNVTDSVSTATGAVVINAGGLGVKSNIHATNVYAETVTANIHATNVYAETVTANVAANSVQATSNVTAPNVYVTGMPLATVGSNLVTWDSSTGQLIDSGGLFSNKLSVVSEHPPEAMTSNTVTVTDHGVYRVRSSGQYSTNVDYSAFNKSTGTYWVSPSGYTGASNVYSASTQLSSASSTALGEWISMEIPYKVKLRYVRLSQGLNAESFPTDAKLYGSTDNNAWTEIKAWTGATAEDTHLVNATTAYNYFALVTTKVAGDYDKTSVGDIKLFCESFSVDGGKVEMPTSTKLSDGSSFIEQTKSKKLIKYPREALTGYSQNGYTVSASSEYNSSYRAWEAFNNIFPPGGDSDLEGWISQTGDYSSTATNGEYLATGTSTFSGAPSGEQDGSWIKLQLPTKIKLNYLVLKQRRNSSAQEYSKNVVVYASVDNSSWHSLGTFDPSGPETFTFYTNTSHYYDYFVLHVKSVNHQYTYTAIEELEYYGVPEYDPDADGTDVIARSVPNVPNTDWLAVYYDGQDYTSMPATVTDKSGNGVTGTPTGDVGFDTEYKAFTFDGASYIDITDVGNASGNWTHSVSFWIKPQHDGSGNDVVFRLGPSADNEVVGFLYSATNMAYYFFNNDFYASYILTNKWYHITLTYDGHERNIYINGGQERFSSTTGGGDLNLGGNDGMRIGTNLASANYMTGSIANFRLFNRALTRDEVWQLYAYQKEYFGHGNLNMTLKGGRLGIGTSEPRAVLDVNGTLRAGNIGYFSVAWTGTNTGIYNSYIPWNTYHTNSGIYSTSIKGATIPVSGYWYFGVFGMTTNAGNAWIEVYLRRNGTEVQERIYGFANNSPYTNGSGFWIQYCDEGDIIQVFSRGYFYCSTGDAMNGFIGFYLSS